MRDALRDVGFELDEAEIDARIADGKPIGRPHLAAAVLARPANAERLRSEDIDDVGSLIRGYLIEGKPAFRLRETPTVAEAVDAIHDAGGLAIWAHPFWDISDPDEVLASIERFHALGIDGVEAFYITHTREQTELLAERCAELDLLTTGSADFHGPENRLFSQFMAFDTFGLEPEPRADRLEASSLAAAAPASSASRRYASASSASSSDTFSDRLKRVSPTSSIASRSGAVRSPSRILLQLRAAVHRIHQLGRAFARRTARRAATARPGAAPDRACACARAARRGAARPAPSRS